jgi:hypothetical protein
MDAIYFSETSVLTRTTWKKSKNMSYRDVIQFAASETARNCNNLSDYAL